MLCVGVFFSMEILALAIWDKAQLLWFRQICLLKPVSFLAVFSIPCSNSRTPLANCATSVSGKICFIHSKMSKNINSHFLLGWTVADKLNTFQQSSKHLNKFNSNECNLDLLPPAGLQSQSPERGNKITASRV